MKLKNLITEAKFRSSEQDFSQRGNIPPPLLFVISSSLVSLNNFLILYPSQVSYLYRKVDKSAVSKMARDVVRNIITPELYIKINLHGKGDSNKEGWTELHMFQVQQSKFLTSAFFRVSAVGTTCRISL